LLLRQKTGQWKQGRPSWKMVTQWHCSGCTSVRGKGLLHQKCIEGVEKLRQARAALKAARTLEREFSERVSNPLRMAKTGEVHTPFVVLRLIVLTRKSNDLEPQNPSWSLFVYCCRLRKKWWCLFSKPWRMVKPCRLHSLPLRHVTVS
jgi:hypothetical protein